MSRIVLIRSRVNHCECCGRALTVAEAKLCFSCQYAINRGLELAQQLGLIAQRAAEQRGEAIN